MFIRVLVLLSVLAVQSGQIAFCQDQGLQQGASKSSHCDQMAVMDLGTGHHQAPKGMSSKSVFPSAQMDCLYCQVDQCLLSVTGPVGSENLLERSKTVGLKLLSLVDRDRWALLQGPRATGPPQFDRPRFVPKNKRSLLAVYII